MTHKKINGCVHLRHLRYMKFETDIYFHKAREIFFAEIPPSGRREAKSSDELEVLLREYHEQYLVPGRWVRKIYVVVTGNQEDTGGGLFHGAQNGQGQSRNLNVAFTLFEERDGGCPPGTRMGRVWDPDPDPRWEDDRRRIYGEDFSRMIERTDRDEEDGTQAEILDWTQEREDALRQIHEAMAQLQQRLGELVKRPELIAGTPMGLLGPGKKSST